MEEIVEMFLNFPGRKLKNSDNSNTASEVSKTRSVLPGFGCDQNVLKIRLASFWWVLKRGKWKGSTPGPRKNLRITEAKNQSRET